MTGGEGLHNNHHGYPRSPKFSFRRSEFDPAWPIIQLMVAMKLAKPYKTIEEVATRFGISRNHLMKVAFHLGQGGILKPCGAATEVYAWARQRAEL